MPKMASVVFYSRQGWCGFCGSAVDVEDMVKGIKNRLNQNKIKKYPDVIHHKLCGKPIRVRPRTSWHRRTNRERQGIKRID